MALENIRMYGNLMQYLYDNNKKNGFALKRSDFSDVGGKFHPSDVEYFWDYDVERLRKRFSDALIDEVMYGWPSIKSYDSSSAKSSNEIISITCDFRCLFYDELDHVSAQLQDLTVEENRIVLGLYDHLKDQGLDFEFEISDIVFDYDGQLVISVIHHRLDNPKTVYFELATKGLDHLDEVVVRNFAKDAFVKDLNEMKELGVPLEASFNGNIDKIAREEAKDINMYIKAVREYGNMLEDMKIMDEVYDDLNQGLER